jgi:hypothetical protein
MHSAHDAHTANSHKTGESSRAQAKLRANHPFLRNPAVARIKKLEMKKIRRASSKPAVKAMGQTAPSPAFQYSRGQLLRASTPGSDEKKNQTLNGLKIS